MPRLGASKANPVQALKRQQVSSVISASARQAFKGKRAYSSEIAEAMVESSRNLGMGFAAIGLTGAGVGIGLVFASLLNAFARNPALRGQLFQYAILGFAFVEAIGLFDLMIALMAKFVSSSLALVLSRLPHPKDFQLTLCLDVNTSIRYDGGPGRFLGLTIPCGRCTMKDRGWALPIRTCLNVFQVTGAIVGSGLLC